MHQTRQPTSNQGLMGCRYEMKYLISEAQAERVRRFIRPYLPPDKYARERHNHAYPISSLYLDSDQLHLCRESLTGKKNRFKLRVRAYDDQGEDRVFAEIKRRANTVIIKSRCAIPRTQLHAVLGDTLNGRTLWSQDPALEQFRLYLRSIRARPKVLVRYQRQAFEARGPFRLRITFDRDLSFKEAHAGDVWVGGSGWQKIPLSAVILEIKFTRCYPAWLEQLARGLNLRAQSVSKYTASVRQSHLLGFCAPQVNMAGG